MRDDNTAPRDNQQIKDDNEQAGTSVADRQRSGDNRRPTVVGHEEVPANPASNRDPAEGVRD